MNARASDNGTSPTTSAVLEELAEDRRRPRQELVGGSAAPAGHDAGGGDHVHVHAPIGTGRTLAFLVVLLITALAVGFILRYRHHRVAELKLQSETAAAADAPPPVDVVRVSHAPTAGELTLPGDARAWYQSTIYARVNGYVKGWQSDIGDTVKQGQVLAIIDTPDLDAQLAAAKARLNAGEQDVAVAAANRDFARSTYERWQKARAGTVSIQETEEKLGMFKAAQATYQADLSRVKLDEAEVTRLKALTDFQKVTAPFDGVITARDIDPGDLVTAGSTANTTPLYSIAQEDRIRVFVDVPQSAAAAIRTGAIATVVAPQLPGQTFAGRVARTTQSIDPSAKTLGVEVDMENPKLTLLPGMYVNVTFQTSAARPLLLVPASAVTFSSGGPEVAVVGAADHVLHFHRILIVRDMGDYVETDSGIRDGDLVALNISNQVAEGDRVTVNELRPDAVPGGDPSGASSPAATRPAGSPASRS